MNKFEKFLTYFPSCCFGVFLYHAVKDYRDALPAFLWFLAVSAICGIVLFILHRKKK